MLFTFAKELTDLLPRVVSGEGSQVMAGALPGPGRANRHREGKRVTIGYAGEVDHAAVLDRYPRGFATQGYAQGVQSATPSTETHEYTKGGERITLKIARLPRGAVSVRIETPLQ